MNEIDTFRVNLARILTEKRMSKTELARRIGCTDWTVALWLQGKNDPRMSKLVRCAEALEVSLDALCRNKKPADEEDEDAVSGIAKELIAQSVRVNAELKALNRSAKKLKDWSKKYYLIGDEEELQG